MAQRYTEVLDPLRAAYDGGAAARDAATKEDFKVEERAAFGDRLRVIEATTLLEIGAGTGQDSAYFAENGFAVTAVDLSPEMVRRCQDKGLLAYERDVLHLGFEANSFSAVYSVNCLLHVPNADLPDALLAIREVLAPGGLFYLGLWGGRSEEGISATDTHEPKRFFSFRSHEQILAYAQQAFEVVDFHTVESRGYTFQALTLVAP
jgi:SAM-dependent methyltransferase